MGLLQRQKELEADLQRARERIVKTRQAQKDAEEAKKKEALSGTLRKLEEEQFVKVKEKHKIDGKLQEDAALREVVRMCNTIAREVELSSSGTELIRKGLESKQNANSRSPAKRETDEERRAALSQSGQRLIKNLKSDVAPMPSVNPILAAAKNIARPDTHSRYRAAPASRHIPATRLQSTASKLEAIDRPLTSDLENTKREPHPVLSESRPHTTHDITSTSNFLQGVDQKLLKQTASLARQLDSRGRVLKTPSSRGGRRRVPPNGGHLSPVHRRR